MIRGLLIPVAGNPEVIRFDWRDFTKLYEFLDCRTVEAVHVPSATAQLVMFIDEEGKFESKPLNRAATALVEDVLRVGDYIAGPALICCQDEHGGLIDLPVGEALRLGARLVKAEFKAITAGPTKGQ